jgi:hypothetical protein
VGLACGIESPQAVVHAQGVHDDREERGHPRSAVAGQLSVGEPKRLLSS